MRPLFKLSYRQLLNSGLGPLTRYGTNQETISGRHEQKYLPSDQDWNGRGEGPLFESDWNEHRGPKRGHYWSYLLDQY